MTIEGVEEEWRWRGGKLCLGHTTGLPERRLVTGAGATALESKDTFSGETPLIAQLGQYENVKRLLQAGPDPNAATAGTPPAVINNNLLLSASSPCGLLCACSDWSPHRCSLVLAIQRRAVQSVCC